MGSDRSVVRRSVSASTLTTVRDSAAAKKARCETISRIRVVVRKRPLSRKEAENSRSRVLEVAEMNQDASYAQLIVYEPKVKVDMTAYTEQHRFNYDMVTARRPTRPPRDTLNGAMAQCGRDRARASRASTCRGHRLRAPSATRIARTGVRRGGFQRDHLPRHGRTAHLAHLHAGPEHDVLRVRRDGRGQDAHDDGDRRRGRPLPPRRAGHLHQAAPAGALALAALCVEL
eukprot:4606588-Prymnesium_polylepis.1